jgi:iron complex transport system substrate-binding protein
MRKALALIGVVAACTALAAPAEAAKPKRIVALTPFAANTLVRLGIKPVAVGKTPGNVKLHRKLRKVRKLPLSHASNGPNLEQLAQLDPDLVFSERTWKAGHSAIRQLGIKVTDKDPRRVGQIPKRIRQIGKVVKRAKRAKKLARSTQKAIRKSRRNIRSRPRVLMILGVGQTPYAFLPNSWGGDLVARAGGRLLTDGLTADGEGFMISGGFAQLSNEEIISRNPDVVIAVPHGRGEDRKEIADGLRNHPYIGMTNAGQNGRVYVTARNTLLQAGIDAAQTIKLVRKRFLRN